MKALTDKIRSQARTYRPLPFFTLNDRLEEPLLADKAGRIAACGTGGFFMHARSGLETPYLSEEWMQAVGVLIEVCEREGMECWAYDEDGWPSGFAGGLVPALSRDYWVKWLVLRQCAGPEQAFAADNLLGVYDVRQGSVRRILRPEAHSGQCCAVCFESNSGYADVLNPEAMKKFLELTHEKYYQRFGNRIRGIFTDEPQYGQLNVPWSPLIAARYREAYGEDLLEILPEIFLDLPGSSRTRYRFYETVSALFLENFFGQISDWCARHGYLLTGHGLEEKLPSLQVRSGGDLMSAYEYMDVPGMDWLGRHIGTEIAPKQVSSVCRQLGKARNISESYALVGYNPSIEELKWIAEWQYVNGISNICYVLQYSARGERKRDYPSGLVLEQPYYCECADYNLYLSRLGAITGGMEEVADVLLLSPLKSAYLHADGSANAALERIDSAYEHAAEWLGGRNICHHIGNENTLRRHGRVEGGRLWVGQCAYRTVILPPLDGLDASTVNLLRELKAQGGRVYACGALPGYLDGAPASEQAFAGAMELLPSVEAFVPEADLNEGFRVESRSPLEGEIRTTLRKDGDRRVLFVLNQSRESTHTFTVRHPGSNAVQELELLSLETMPLSARSGADGLSFEVTLAPMQSKVLVLYRNGNAVQRPSERVYVRPREELFECAGISPNALCLDRCVYAVDGQEYGREKTAVILLFQRLLKERRNCSLKMKFDFSVRKKPESPMYLALERAEKFGILINGQPLSVPRAGSYVNEHIGTYDVSALVREGENTVELVTEFFQRDEVYHVMLDEGVLESEKNKVTFDTELENVYIIGDFGVFSQDLTDCNGLAVTDGGFFIDQLPRKFSPERLNRQGLLFFAGKILLRTTVEVGPRGDSRVWFPLELHCPLANLYVNGAKVRTVMWKDYDTDITDYVHEGVNVVELEIYSSLRNLLGPHHNVQGEPLQVGMTTFTDERGWCDPLLEHMYTDRYHFVDFGVRCGRE